MSSSVVVLPLELRPSRRPEALDLRESLADALTEGPLSSARRLLCISYHTTAGFMDRGLRGRLGSDEVRLSSFLDALATVFPQGAGYEHDRLHLRDELSDDQKEREPLNADAHLAFIGGGFTNSTICEAQAKTPVWFVDFDGVFRDRRDRVIRRTRRATVVGYDEEIVVDRIRIEVPVPEGAAGVRLDDPDLAVIDRIQDLVRSAGIGAGRVRIHLVDDHPGVGLTMNEFEALLMKHDLTRMLEDPFGYSGLDGIERDLNAGDVLGPALVGAMTALRVSPERVERLLGRALGGSSRRVLRMQRDLSLPVLPRVEPVGGGSIDPSSPGTLVMGTYQSPILVQRCGPPNGTRTLAVSLRRFR